jgi:hypothetical protein
VARTARTGTWSRRRDLTTSAEAAPELFAPLAHIVGQILQPAQRQIVEHASKHHVHTSSINRSG